MPHEVALVESLQRRLVTVEVVVGTSAPPVVEPGVVDPDAPEVAAGLAGLDSGTQGPRG
jgi:hypothetical protein